MSILLSIYSQKAYQEHELPPISNGVFTVNFYKDIFGFSGDIAARLECRNGSWYFVPSMTYRVTKDGQDWFDHALAVHDILDFQSADGTIVTMVVRSVEQPFHPFLKIDLTGVSQITVGKNESCDISVNVMGLVSRQHMTFTFEGGRCFLHDTSRNGVYVNSFRSAQTQELTFGDVVNLFGMKFIWMGKVLAIDSSYHPVITNPGLKVLDTAGLTRFMADRKYPDYYQTEVHMFKRSPRNVVQLSAGTVEIEPPPAKVREDRRSVLAEIGPSLTMAIPMILGSGLAILGSSSSGAYGGIFMMTGLITAISAAIIGSLWAYINLRNSRKQNALEEQNRQDAYRAYLEAREKEIRRRYEYNTEAMLQMYPSAAACSRYNSRSLELWGRNSSQKDFLYERLGIGSEPFQTEIKISAPKFQVYRDELAERPVEIRKKYEMLENVPVGVDLLEHRLIGVLGGRDKAGAYQVADSLITQIAANNAYTEVKIALVYNREKQIEESCLSQARWLPHVWSEDRKTRFVADGKQEAGDVFFELAEVFRKRADETQPENGTVPKPYYVLFLTDLSFLDGELISKYVLEPKKIYGLTTVLLASGYDELPNTCDLIIENDSTCAGTYSVGTERTDYRSIAFDSITPSEFGLFAKRLANIRLSETEHSGEVPASVSFFDMYHVKKLEDLNVESRWARNCTYESLKVPIGEKSGGETCYLDVHEKYHGPHGLIAGTTGSGKSETLETYILSLAVNFSPDDVGFFIIDYKGGGMANLFDRLPHMMGSISNLSGSQVRRAMISIKSENERRQRIFNENGVNNINQYTRLYRNHETDVPVPHLFIIIDEFAELKREQPEFMQELISVAQVGRSLGVHLILSTQKPAGTVDDNIWSNTKFRLCLRVQDRQDSMDMLHKPDAAYITQTGRCYLQVGNDELYELFQSGWSGAPYEEDDGSKTDIARMLTMAGKTAMTGNRMRILRQDQRKRKWIGRLLDAIDAALRAGDTAGAAAEDLQRRKNAAGDAAGDIRSRNNAAADAAVDVRRLKNAVSSPDLLSEACTAVFEELRRRDLDYAENDYNTQRMTELIALYAEAADAQRDRKAVIDEILRLALQKGSKIPEERMTTQLEAVVNYIAAVARKNHYEHHFRLWLPVLPEEIFLRQLAGYAAMSYSFEEKHWAKKTRWSLSAQIGLCDDPVSQAQFPLEISLGEDGHFAVIGSVSGGKSTLASTLVYALITRYSPAWLNLYLIDFSSHMLDAFRHAPQVGGIMHEDTPERVGRFFCMISRMIDERKQLFQGGDYAQYVKKNGVVVPAVVIVIDDYTGFREKTGDRYADIMANISRSGVANGIYLVITASGFGASGIDRAVGDNIRHAVGIGLTDRFDYMDILHISHLDVLPEANVPGRGLAKVGESVLEFQTALAVPAADAYDRMNVIDEHCRIMRDAYKGRVAAQIPEIPDRPVESVFYELPEVQAMLEDPHQLPLGYDETSASAYGIRLTDTFSYVISGAARTGKTNVLKLIMSAAGKEGAKLYLFDAKGNLEQFAEEKGAQYIPDGRGLYHALAELQEMFGERTQVRHEAREEGLDDAEIYDRMQEKFRQVFFFIDNMTDFLQTVLHPGEEVPDLSGFLENVTDKGQLHNIFFVSCVDQEDSGRPATAIYDYLLRDHRGIHLGGMIERQSLFRFDFIPYSKQADRMKPGIGLVPSDMEETTQKVILPLAGR